MTDQTSMTEEKAAPEALENQEEAGKSDGNIRITMSKKVFWTGILLACVLIGAAIGVIIFESKQVVEAMDKTLAQKQEYNQLMSQYNELLLLNEELQNEVQALSDTINKRTLEDEAAAKKESDARVPVGFPVTGSVTEAETPEEDIALEKAVYFEAGIESVVVAAANGTVSNIRQNAYGNYEIQVDHGNGYTSIYTNAGYPLVESGVDVLKGTPLFHIQETNTLVKYQISRDGAYIDVYDIMAIDG